MCVSPDEMPTDLLMQRVGQLRQWAQDQRDKGTKASLSLAAGFEHRADLYVKILTERLEEEFVNA